MLRIKYRIYSSNYTHDVCDLYSVISVAEHFGFMRALVDDPTGKGKQKWNLYDDMLDALKEAAIDGTLLDDEMHELTFSCEEV